MIVPAAAVGVPVFFNTAGKVIVDSRSPGEVRAAYGTNKLSLVPLGLLWFRLTLRKDSAMDGWPTFTVPTAAGHLLSRLVKWEQIISDERRLDLF